MIEGNTTSEALAATLPEGDESLIIYSSEAGDFVRMALGKYSKGQQGDFDLLLAGWSSETNFRNRVSSGRVTLVPTLSLLLFVQPHELSRRRENAIRIALNLWLADGAGGAITAEQAERAVQIMLWCVRSYLAILNKGRGALKYARVQRLRAILVELPERMITLRDLANRHSYDQDEVRALAAEFPDMLKIETKTLGSQGGRPSEVLTLATSAGGGY